MTPASATQWWMGSSHLGLSATEDIATRAQRLEADGWDGFTVLDSQSLAGDVYVKLAAAAAATERLRLAPGVTNPGTRHAAVTATAIASVHALSGGRAVLGIGRGDSALAHIGLAPIPVARFAAYLRDVQRYLAGEEVPFEGHAAPGASVRDIPLGSAPTGSRISWLPGALPKVAVDVAATGPRVIELAAQLADGVTFSLGADLARLRWAVELATAARLRAGLTMDGFSLGATMPVIPSGGVSLDRALELAAGTTAAHARFSVMHGEVTTPLGSGDGEVLEELRTQYDMNHHAEASPQSRAMTPDFLGRFAIVGPPESCARRLREIVDLGIRRIAIVGPGIDTPRHEAEAIYRPLATEVLPAVRQ